MYVLRATMSFRYSALACVLLFSTFLSAQYGIRAIIWNYEPVAEETADLMGHFGLGIDHDVNERISNALQFRVTYNTAASWVLNDRSAYHFADTDGPSFYMGPMVGLRSLKSEVDQRMLFPLGLRMGVRGGLQGFFADLHAGLVYNIGASDPILLADQRQPSNLLPVTFCAGLDMGLGWDKR